MDVSDAHASGIKQDDLLLNPRDISLIILQPLIQTFLFLFIFPICCFSFSSLFPIICTSTMRSYFIAFTYSFFTLLNLFMHGSSTYHSSFSTFLIYLLILSMFSFASLFLFLSLSLADFIRI